MKSNEINPVTHQKLETKQREKKTYVKKAKGSVGHHQEDQHVHHENPKKTGDLKKKKIDYLQK